ncbi:porin family protein [Acidicapsa ligni]|uniref:porin family protein n=1 Tax=Acidicapsa ligni TaxID=542300 RepID=UPI0021DFC762|nr:porin family protein [Acidicapsa ligni]
MRSKLVLAALFFLSTLPVLAQVAPAARISGLPLGVGAGLSDYSVDYGPGRRMLGVSAWADYSLFHGLGIEAEGTSILWDKPSSLPRMKQETIKGGAIYKYHQVFHVRPYVKGLIGLGKIDFPSINPLYTQDTFTMYAIGGGVEYKVWKTLSVRGDYEYQYWSNYQGSNYLNPNGFTIGATYYLRGVHRHY